METSGDDWAPGKFKVDGKELDYDEKLKAILNKDNEPHIRELVEKAHGIDNIKARHEEVKAQRDEFQGQLGQVTGVVREILQARDAGDYDSFFEQCNIPFDKVAQWMYQKLKTQTELPESARGMYDENRTYRNQLREQGKTVQQLQAQMQSARAEATATQLESALADPNVTEIANEFDARFGKPGSFRDAVIEHAAAKEHATQRSLSVKEAVQSYLNLLGRTPGQNKTVQPANTASKKVVATPQKNQTLPHVGGSATTPTAERKPKSVAELKQMAKNFR